ncbi:hypothetical protein ES332_A11G281600v1 [Gossypium tomentosum]|uniref:Uncharacterized protein n=1 Tax=Gossypium tomentosum TaxID=34277 RepID=A0A5D2NEX5_GOSTO|nr:hypothetical protein ES332_A11G281600v1 [Gossypium tomentosum]
MVWSCEGLGDGHTTVSVSFNCNNFDKSIWRSGRSETCSHYHWTIAV